MTEKKTLFDYKLARFVQDIEDSELNQNEGNTSPLQTSAFATMDPLWIPEIDNSIDHNDGKHIQMCTNTSPGRNTTDEEDSDSDTSLVPQLQCSVEYNDSEHIQSPDCTHSRKTRNRTYNSDDRNMKCAPQTTRKKVEYNLVHTLKNDDDAKQYFKNNSWSLKYATSTREGKKEFLRCAKVKKRGTQCNASAYALYDSTSFNVFFFKSNADHNHDEIGAGGTSRSGMTKEVKLRIEAMILERKMKPSEIKDQLMKEKLPVPKAYNISNYLAKIKTKNHVGKLGDFVQNNKGSEPNQHVINISPLKMSTFTTNSSSLIPEIDNSIQHNDGKHNQICSNTSPGRNMTYDEDTDTSLVPQLEDSVENNKSEPIPSPDYSLQRKTRKRKRSSVGGSTKYSPQTTRRKVVYNLEHTFKNDDEAKQYFKNNSWSLKSTTFTREGKKIFLRCAKVKKRGKQCSASAYALYNSTSFDVLFFKSNYDHNHDEIGLAGTSRSGMTTEVKLRIEAMTQQRKMKPSEIRYQLMKEKLPVPKAYNISSYLSKIQTKNSGINKNLCNSSPIKSSTNTKNDPSLIPEFDNSMDHDDDSSTMHIQICTNSSPRRNMTDEEDSDTSLVPQLQCSVEYNDGQNMKRAPQTTQTRRKIVYNLEHTFKNDDEAKEFFKNNSWSLKSTTFTREGKKIFLRCAKVKKRGKQCNASACALYDSTSLDVLFFKSNADHNHDEIGIGGTSRSGMTEEVKLRIEAMMLQRKMKPSEVRDQLMKEELPVPKTYNISNYMTKIKAKHFLVD